MKNNNNYGVTERGYIRMSLSTLHARVKPTKDSLPPLQCLGGYHTSCVWCVILDNPAGAYDGGPKNTKQTVNRNVLSDLL